MSNEVPKTAHLNPGEWTLGSLLQEDLSSLLMPKQARNVRMGPSRGYGVRRADSMYSLKFEWWREGQTGELRQHNPKEDDRLPGPGGSPYRCHSGLCRLGAYELAGAPPQHGLLGYVSSILYRTCSLTERGKMSLTGLTLLHAVCSIGWGQKASVGSGAPLRYACYLSQRRYQVPE
ncbi:hypothetical protein NDU88_005632 [Pleurodeles waltl]|uniref:Uncharacterized protein n=1 Tax=Pleurodeles waltl TaxID=8319 RepID=A0AAV7VM91_PLEWA|nr:hypothetical protein NDU88_005632 [Pleurodeles waltl]